MPTPAPLDIAQTLSQAMALHRQGQLAAAVPLYEAILAVQAQHFDALHLLGVACAGLGQAERGLDLLAQAVALRPDNAAAWSNRGNALLGINRLEEALVACDRALALQPGFVDALRNRAAVLEKSSRFEEALVAYDSALALDPKLAHAHNGRGNALFNLKRLEEALVAYDSALALDPKLAHAHNGRGNALKDLKRLEEALAAYDSALALDPKLAHAHNNRGNALFNLKRLEEALDAYDSALALDPKLAHAHNGRGAVLKGLHRLEEALLAYDSALALDPKLVHAHNGRGNVLKDFKRLEEAVAAYEQALEVDPDYPWVAGIALLLRMQTGRWDGLAPRLAALTEGLAQGRPVSAPFVVLGLLDDPALQRRAAEVYAQTRFPRAAPWPSWDKRAAGGKIKVGYYSADFHNHATTHLMAELFEAHDRAGFEWYGFSFGPRKNDAMRQRTAAAFDHFFEVNGQSDAEVAALSRRLGIDIAVDLKGYTQDSRPGIFAQACAPVQVNYLGYPGTLGADWMDYIVADRTVIPPQARAHFSEQVVYLPQCYQPNDSQRRIAEREFGRAELGLPEQGVVFACFNNNYKVLPGTFEVWMRILQAVPGSVLWLLQDNPQVEGNWRAQAQSRGVEPQRLVFAPRMPLDLHLARQRCADLFLDTLPYNAHTTASDALWAGLPVLTCMGEAFAGRVAASLLQTLGLPELVTHSLTEYEALAVGLAQQPQRLAELKQRLWAARGTSPLFDGRGLARHLEAVYRAMDARRQAGLAPAPLEIGSETEAGAGAGGGALLPTPTLANTACPVFPFMSLSGPIQVMDVGAAAIAEVPVYQGLLQQGWAHLHAFEGDERQIERIQSAYGAHATVHSQFLFDGTPQTLYLASAPSGMTSLLPPKEQALRFFNGFDRFGAVERTLSVATHTLDSIAALPALDFVKMDIQGAELTVLRHGLGKLQDCVAIQLEVSYIALYENQPTFGEVDVWMRAQGYVPHCFLDVKRWSIAPTIFNNNFRVPGKQLLESDVVYIKDPLHLDRLGLEPLKKLAALAHHAFKSPDLCVFVLREIARRQPDVGDLQRQYLASLKPM